MNDKSVESVKSTDFGIAKVIDSGLATVETSANKFGCASPEQRVSLASADERSDVYSADMVVYRMLIGELPSGVHTAQPMESNPQMPAPERLIPRLLLSSLLIHHSPMASLTFAPRSFSENGF